MSLHCTALLGPGHLLRALARLLLPVAIGCLWEREKERFQMLEPEFLSLSLVKIA